MAPGAKKLFKIKFHDYFAMYSLYPKSTSRYTCVTKNDRMMLTYHKIEFRPYFDFSYQELIVQIRSFVDVDGRIIFTEFYKIGINESGLMKFHVYFGTG